MVIGPNQVYSFHWFNFHSPLFLYDIWMAFFKDLKYFFIHRVVPKWAPYACLVMENFLMYPSVQSTFGFSQSIWRFIYVLTSAKFFQIKAKLYNKINFPIFILHSKRFYLFHPIKVQKESTIYCWCNLLLNKAIRADKRGYKSFK